MTAIVSSTDIRLNTLFTLTGDGTVDFSVATTIELTYGGVSLTGLTNVTTNTVDFLAPLTTLTLGVTHDLILTVDGDASAAFPQLFLPPENYSVVTFASIGENSFLNKPTYVGNPGGAANNISTNDEFIYENLNGFLSFSDTGIPSLAEGHGLTENPTINWFYREAQANYVSGEYASLTLILSALITLVSVSPASISLGEAFIVTVDSSTDLTALTSIRAYYGGIDIGQGIDITVSTVKFFAPNYGLELKKEHSLKLIVF